MKTLILVMLLAAMPLFAQAPPTKITVGEPFLLTLDYPHFSATARGCADSTELDCISAFHLWDITGGQRFSLGMEPAPAGASAPMTGLSHLIDGANNQRLGLRKFVATTVLRTEIGDFESIDSVEARAVMVPLPGDGTRVNPVP
ncbi:hypothetical protein LCGC14_0630290 [marine sediment metagenome]|uniref:Uncharacterized protein n=1 Tax=marine sediment metagenome TaxID=412755 RepID=A0A0F9R222_9ZZZZ